jgi:hypothetical protein
LHLSLIIVIMLHLSLCDWPQQEQYRSTGEEVRRASLQQMKDQLALFKSKLEEFALQHKADIRRDPVFRAQFHTMCANIGVDPLSSNKVGVGRGTFTCVKLAGGR